MDTPKGVRMGESVSAGVTSLFLARLAHNMYFSEEAGMAKAAAQNPIVVSGQKPTPRLFAKGNGGLQLETKAAGVASGAARTRAQAQSSQGTWVPWGLGGTVTTKEAL